jgi:hypothetical protein
MTDTDIEEEMLQLSNEFEKAIQKHEQKEPEPDEAEPEMELEVADSALAALQKRYDYIVAANERNQRRIRHLVKLLDEMGRKAERLGLRFDQMDDLAD